MRRSSTFHAAAAFQSLTAFALLSVLPVVDAERQLLAVQFEVDPGEMCAWNRDEMNESVVRRTELNHEDRLALLNQFLDLVDIPCPAGVKPGSTFHRLRAKVVDDREQQRERAVTDTFNRQAFP